MLKKDVNKKSNFY